MWDKSTFIPLSTKDGVIAIQVGIVATITAQMTALWWWWGGGGYKKECEISYISGTCSYLGVSCTYQSPSLSGIWRNPGGVGLIVGNYGNDCVL